MAERLTAEMPGQPARKSRKKDATVAGWSMCRWWLPAITATVASGTTASRASRTASGK